MKRFFGYIASGFIAFFLLVSVITSFDGEGGPFIGFILLVAVAFGTVVLGRYIFKGAEKAKDKAKEKVQEYQKDKDIKQNISNYESAKDRFKYVSDDLLEDRYNKMESEGVENMERLALEEEMVDRGILEYSFMHEKFENIIDNLKGR